MLTWWARKVIKFRRFVLAGALVLAAIGVTWGAGVFSTLVSGGFNDPGSQSALAAKRISAELGNQNPDVLVIYSDAKATTGDPAFQRPVTAAIARVRKLPGVASVVSYYDTRSPALISRNHHATYIAVRLAALDDSGKRAEYAAIRPKLAAAGVTTQIGGDVAVQAAADAISKSDVTRGEMAALPIVLVLLVLIFGGLVAASMPLVVGGLAILGALTATRLIAAATDVSTFAVNSITVLGLGMGIDYSLVMVSRFRDELRAGRDTRQAITATMATAGRTVLVSGLTVALSLASLLVFPEVFLRSMALGGMAAVLVAMLSALIVLPALLTVAGPRINALRIRLPWQRGSHDGVLPPAAGERGAWARLAHSVMRRPARYVTTVLVMLAILALPLLHVRFGGVDQRMLPAGTQARVVAERVATEFHGAATSPIETLIEGASPAQAHSLAGQIRALPGITSAQVTAHRGGAWLVSVNYPGDPAGSHASTAVSAIRDLHAPAGVQVLVTGTPAVNVDQLASLGARLPWMAAIMAAVTLVLLFLAFGSVLLPVKAVLTNMASIGASFGVLVWGFQDGHLAGLLGFTPAGYLEPTVLILVLAVLFGLATDYEVFLLSRVREQWDTTGDNTGSVATGLQRTGPIITAAALLLVTVAAGLATGQIVLTKLIGTGMVVAITLDATLIRAVLVPATMRLLGQWNWWAPGPLARAYRRYGIRDADAPVPAPPRETSPAGARA
jgi:RND superfamily putative drug exporter